MSFLPCVFRQLSMILHWTTNKDSNTHFLAIHFLRCALKCGLSLLRLSIAQSATWCTRSNFIVRQNNYRVSFKLYSPVLRHVNYIWLVLTWEWRIRVHTQLSLWKYSRYISFPNTHTNHCAKRIFLTSITVAIGLNVPFISSCGIFYLNVMADYLKFHHSLEWYFKCNSFIFNNDFARVRIFGRNQNIKISK